MLTVDFHGVQSCDCCNYSIVDDTNYIDNIVSLFSARTLTLTYASGNQDVIDWAFDDGNIKVINQSKDFVAIATLRLTAISPIDGTIYFKDKNIITTCKSDSMARAKQKELLTICDRPTVLYQLMDINSGIDSAKRLNRLGLIEEAQDVLTYLDRTYGHSCDCGCGGTSNSIITSTTTTTTVAPLLQMSFLNVSDNNIEVPMTLVYNGVTTHHTIGIGENYISSIVTTNDSITIDAGPNIIITSYESFGVPILFTGSGGHTFTYAAMVTIIGLYPDNGLATAITIP